MTYKYWKGKNVVVAGGAGLIGSYLAEQLLYYGAWVIAVDDFSRGSMRNIQQLDNKNPRFSWIRLDLRRTSRCKDVLPIRPEVVFNLAAPSYGIGYSNRHHNEMLKNTLAIGLNLTDYAIKYASKLVLVSSSCVYGDDAPVPTPEVCGHQDYPEEANAGYGWAKRVLEIHTNYCRLEGHLDSLIVRPFNTYGPRVPVYGDARDPVLISIINRALRGEDPLHLLGDGNQTRAFLHAKDVATAIRLLTEKSGVCGPINIGSNQEHSIKELVDYVRNITNLKFTTKYEEGDYLRGARRKASDNAFLRYHLPNWEPKISFSDGLVELINYIRSENEI